MEGEGDGLWLPVCWAAGCVITTVVPGATLVTTVGSVFVFVVEGGGVVDELGALVGLGLDSALWLELELELEPEPEPL